MLPQILTEAARDNRITDIEASAAGQLLLDAGLDITGERTDTELRTQARALKGKEEFVNRIIQAGGTTPKSELYALDTATLGTKANEVEQRRRNENLTGSQEYQDLQDDKNKADRRYYDNLREQREERKQGRLDRLDDRMSEREVRMLELGMRERMFDKELAAQAQVRRQERGAAIAAALASLTGAFVL